MPRSDPHPDPAGMVARAPAPLKAQAGWKWSIYPFLFSQYPVLFLYLRNIREVRLAQVFWAAAISLAIAIAGWFLTAGLGKSRGKRVLALFLFLLLFYFYGAYYDLIAGLLPRTSRPLRDHLLAFIPAGAIWCGLIVLVARSRGTLNTLNRTLQTTILLLLAWNIGGIVVHHAGPLFDHSLPNRPENRLSPTDGARLPDIYCFVLDEFAAPESARLLFGYDNSALVVSLRRLGFFVAEQSRSLHVLTEPAIAAILNLGEFSGGQDPFQQVRRNIVAAQLKKQGYRVIEFACQRPLFLEASDQRFYYHLAHASIFFDDFYRTLFEHSLLRVLPDLWQLQKTDLSRFYRERILQVFAELPGVVKTPGPKFVFIHLFSPHEPFVFDAEGRPTDPGHIWDHADPRYYLGQYIYISRRLQETAAMILANSPAPPVIMMQSDHGYRGSRRRGNESKPVCRSEMTRVFNALYLPAAPADAIPPSLSPRNNFRLVFNFVFNSRYPFLQDP